VADRTFVIVGASLTAATAAATLRGSGFDGRLIMLGDEPHEPYERPGLSKAYLRGEEPAEELFVRPPGWWEEQEIEVRLGTILEVGPSPSATAGASRSMRPWSRPASGTGCWTCLGPDSTGCCNSGGSRTPTRSVPGLSARAGS